MTKTDRRGGKRPGAGRPKGSRNRTTLAKLVGGELHLQCLDDAELVAYARHHAAEIVTTLATMVHDPKVPAAARVNAGSLILGYAYGRPRPRPSDAGDGKGTPPLAPTVPVLPPGATIPEDYPWLMANSPEEANRLVCGTQGRNPDRSKPPGERQGLGPAHRSRVWPQVGFSGYRLPLVGSQVAQVDSPPPKGGVLQSLCANLWGQSHVVIFINLCNL